MTNFNDKTVAELKSIAKEMGLVGYSKLKKALLIELIEANIPPVEEEKDTKKETPVAIKKEVTVFMNRHMRRRKEKLARIMNRKKTKTL